MILNENIENKDYFFVIFCHSKEREYFDFLINSISFPQSHIIIVFNKYTKYNSNFIKKYQHSNNVSLFFLKNEWGTSLLVQNRLKIINHLLKNNIKFKSLIFLDENSFPIVSKDKIKKFLDSNCNKTFFKDFKKNYFNMIPKYDSFDKHNRFWELSINNTFYSYLSSANLVTTKKNIIKIICLMYRSLIEGMKSFGIIKKEPMFWFSTKNNKIIFKKSEWWFSINQYFSFEFCKYINDTVNKKDIKYLHKQYALDERFWITLAYQSPQEIQENIIFNWKPFSFKYSNLYKPIKGELYNDFITNNNDCIFTRRITKNDKEFIMNSINGTNVWE